MNTFSLAANILNNSDVEGVPQPDKSSTSEGQDNVNRLPPGDDDRSRSSLVQIPKAVSGKADQSGGHSVKTQFFFQGCCPTRDQA